MSLPSGYKRVEYIQSSGTQYIDTGVKPNNNTRVVIDFTYLSGDVVFGSYNSNGSNGFALQYVSGKWYTYYGTSNGYGVTATTGTRHLVDINKNVATIDGVTLRAASTNTFSGANSIAISALNYGTVRYWTTIKLYSFQIYDNGTLIRDFVPAVNSSGTAGLYDLANDVFYTNAGSGTFSVGPRVVESLDGWNELVYIDTPGTAYIDTGFLPNGNSRVVMDTQVLTTPTLYFGTRNASSTTAAQNFSCLPLSTGGMRSDYMGTSKSMTSVVATDRTVVDQNKNVCSADGYSVTHTLSSTQVAYPLYLFAFNTAGTATTLAGTIRVWSVKIYDNGTMVRDYIPYRSPEGDVGLYDAANGVFYENAGTGVFVGGPRVVRSLKGWTPVEYIESTGTQYINTGVTPNNNSRVVMDFQPGSGTAANGLFGACDGWIADAFIVLGKADKTTYHTYYAGTRIDYPLSNATERHTIDANKNVFYFDGAIMSSFSGQAFTCEQNLLVFAWNKAGVVSNKATIKVFSCKIYDNGTPIRDYLPYVDQDGVAGLYDRQNSTFYENAGTGTFSVGASLVPGVPTNLAATATQGQVSLSWNAATNAEGYRIYRDWALIASVIEPGYTDTVSEEGTYLYEVTAYNEFAESESVSTSVKVVLEIPCPGCFQQTEQGINSVCLTWDPVECEKYRLYRDGELIAEPTTTSYTDTGLESYSTYTYAVTAIVNGEESAPVVVMAQTASVYEVNLVSVDSAAFSVNPVNINTKTVLTVSISEKLMYLEPAKRYVGELYSGEV